MKLLLDTHIWFWSLVEPARLSSRVARHLADPENELWLSPISVWELIVLAEKGRVRLDSEPAVWVRDALRRVSVKEAAMNYEIAVESRNVDLPHQDPADRFLAATARVYELTLVTQDERLLGVSGITSVSNR